MLRKEYVERFEGLEEKVHLLGGLLATLFVLTLAVQHRLATIRPTREVPEWLETFDHILITLDVAIAVLFISGLLFKRFFLRKSNHPFAVALKDKELNPLVANFLYTNSSSKDSSLHVRFCTLEDIKELTELNYSAFSASSFATEEEKLKARDASWIKRNKRVFMFSYEPIFQNQVIGYSSMLPLTQEGIDCYLAGDLKDSGIPASLVAEDRTTTAAVLLFAIHLKDDFSFTKSQAARIYTTYFLTCVYYHARQLFGDDSLVGDYPPMYLQTEDNSLKKRVCKYGFVNTKKMSADGFPILMLEHPFKAINAAVSPVPDV